VAPRVLQRFSARRLLVPVVCFNTDDGDEKFFYTSQLFFQEFFYPKIVKGNSYDQRERPKSRLPKNEKMPDLSGKEIVRDLRGERV